MVVGSCGQLGRVISDRFEASSWDVLKFDASASEGHVQLPPEMHWVEQAEYASQHAGERNPDGVDAVIVTAGGWAGGGIGSSEGLRSLDQMWSACGQSAAIAGHLACHHLKPGGLVVFTGASAAVSGSGTVGMVGYGMAKAATHHLVQNMAASDELPAGSTVCAILPATIDTPMNRQFMPDADHSTWAPMGEISDTIFQWSEGTQRPSNGALITLVTTDGVTDFISADDEMNSMVRNAFSM